VPPRSFCKFRDDATVEANSAGQVAGPQSCPNAPSALAEVARWLRCPQCAAAPLRRESRTVRCPSGHSFDIARQGYVSLLTGSRRRHRGDSPAMIAAREQFLSRGHYRPLQSTLTALAVEHGPPGPNLVVDLAGGTGHYLAGVLDGLTSHWGVTVDLSTAALRRAARSHPRACAVAADVWGELPLASGAAGAVLSVFGPRNVAEIERILTGDGIVLVATAAPDHLRELRRLVGAIGVDPRKRERLDAALSSFEPIVRQPVTWRLALLRAEAEDLVAMGPSAHHADRQELRAALARAPALVGATASIDVVVFRRRR